MNNRRSATAEGFGREGEGMDAGVAGEDGVDGVAKLADAFAVDDAEFENSAFLAKGNVIEQNVADVFGPERVQIEDAVNRQVDSWWRIWRLVCHG
jgi:hypothetical protein